MKRFFATFGFAFVLSLLLLNNFFKERAVLYFTVSLCLFVLTLGLKNKPIIKELSCILFVFAFSSAIFIGYTEILYKPQIKLAGEKYDIKATVLDYPSISSGGNYSYLIKTKSFNGEEKKIRLRLYTPYDICAEPYDDIEFSSRLFVLGENDESILEHFKSKRTFLGAYTKFDVYVHGEEKKPAFSFFLLQKGKSEKRLRKNLDADHAEFAVSILFGDKTYLSSETRDMFSVSGLSHIMAVSGLHMSVWVLGLYRLLRRIRFDDRICGGLCIIACWCLVFFCAFSVSVIRAAIMLTVYFSASFFRRKSDALNSLGIAAAAICTFNPFAVCDVSFLLSVFATLGILVFSLCFSDLLKFKDHYKTKNKALSYFIGCIGICISANIFTAPVLIRYFSHINTWVVLGNLLVSLAVAPCLVLAGALSVCPEIKIIAYPVRAILSVLEKYIFSVAGFVSRLPFADVFADNTFLRLIFPLSLILLTYTLYAFKPKRVSLTSLLPVLCAVIITVT